MGRSAWLPSPTQGAQAQSPVTNFNLPNNPSIRFLSQSSPPHPSSSGNGSGSPPKDCTYSESLCLLPLPQWPWLVGGERGHLYKGSEALEEASTGGCGIAIAGVLKSRLEETPGAGLAEAELILWMTSPGPGQSYRSQKQDSPTLPVPKKPRALRSDLWRSLGPSLLRGPEDGHNTVRKLGACLPSMGPWTEEGRN